MKWTVLPLKIQALNESARADSPSPTLLHRPRGWVILVGMTGDKAIIDQYHQSALAETILAALGAAASGDAVDPDALAPADELHCGGRAATAHIMTYLQFQPQMHVLDVGSGLGGAARFAAKGQVRVTGIDLTPSYCTAAAELSHRAGLAALTSFRQGSALAMPFPNAEFDGAYSLHTAMNIADKAVLYHEIARVLKPGAFFGLYDVLRGPAGGLPAFPLPWAAAAEQSFLAAPEEMRRFLGEAGFEIMVEDDLSGFALLSLKKLQAVNPAFGPALVMGEDAPRKIENLVAAIADKKCAPTLMICKKRTWDDRQ